MPTIKDIAALAGVTPTTVSNVLHNKVKRVSPETVEKIKGIIKETGYVPNMSARSLVGNSSRIIGVISSLVPLSSGGFFQDPFHAVLLSGIEQRARQANYYLMVRTVENAQELGSLLSNWNIDGLIMTGAFPNDFYEQMDQLRKPYVQIDSPEAHGLHILLDDEQGGYLASKHLLENGHRNIIFCCPPRKESIVISNRYHGYCRALQEYDLSPREDFIYESEFSNIDGIALGKELAARTDYTAIFATADILASELCTGLMISGRKIPDEISVVGFDDTNIGRINCPPLTTIHQDVGKRGEKAVEMLLDAIENNIQDASCRFPVTLVERESVKRLL